MEEMDAASCVSEWNRMTSVVPTPENTAQYHAYLVCLVERMYYAEPDYEHDDGDIWIPHMYRAVLYAGRALLVRKQHPE